MNITLVQRPLVRPHSRSGASAAQPGTALVLIQPSFRFSHSALVPVQPSFTNSAHLVRSRTRAVLVQPNNLLVQLGIVLVLAQVSLVLVRSCSQSTLVQLNNVLVQLSVSQQRPETSFPHGRAEARDFGLGFWSP